MIRSLTLTIVSFFLFAVVQGEEAVRFTVLPQDQTISLGDPVLLSLHFERMNGPPIPITLGESALSAVTITAAGSDNVPKTYKLIPRDGFDQHTLTDLMVDEPVDYGVILDDFVVLAHQGVYQIDVTISGKIPLMARARITIGEEGKGEKNASLERLAKVALMDARPRSNRLDAGRILCRYWRKEAVPHLMVLMQQYEMHGTNVMTDAFQSIMRSDDPHGVAWLWEDVVTGKVPALRQYAEFFKAHMNRYAQTYPESQVNKIRNP